ncbi:MAG: helix-hairpin-helix domain-containing protein [Ginsengibacter sp.]
MWRHFLHDYFIFTRKERTGIIFIVSILGFFILIPFAFPFFLKQKQYSHKEFESEIARLKTEANDSSKNKSFSRSSGNEFYDDYSPSGKKNYERIKAEIFYFDPNTISSEDWKRLGVRDKTITTIQKYLSKGGRFNKPEDISKIWGLSEGDQQRLIPYVSIKSIIHESETFVKKEYSKPSSFYTPKANQPVDVNLADTTEYISLPGIGSKLSQRIIAFRNKLGGFYSVNQVGETYMLPDSTFQKIKSRLFISNSTVKQININSASAEEMKAHPYIRYIIANAIFQYRQQHGNFNSVVEIKKIMLVTDDIYNKVAPYLSVQ